VGSVGDMTEYETNPQRHEGSSPEDLSHRPADASYQSGTPAADESSSAPAPYGEQPTATQSSSAPPYAEQPTAQQPAATQQSWTASPWQQHQPYAGGYQQPHPGYGRLPAYQAQPHQQYASAYAGGVPVQQPGPEVPPWAQPVGTEQPGPAGSGRGRRIFVAGAAAVLIALGAGGVGAAAALAFDDDGSSPTVQTGNSSVTRVVDRSSLAQIAAAVRDSVVSITTDSGEGSGVILTADGYIVTNNHVVATAQGGSVQVIFANGKKATATVVGTDARTDLAVVKATNVSGLKPAKFGSSAQMQVGDTVLALGSPLGLEGSVTSGIISAKDRTMQASDQNPQNPFGGQQQQQSAPTTMSGLLQTDAPINPGNSGGALVNTNGEVIGINSSIVTSGQGSGNIGLGFAIPSDKVSKVAGDLMAGKKVSHPALGVSVTEAEGGGALVSSVTPNSGAAKAEIQQGDVITSVNGKPINTDDDLVGIIQSGSVGDKITIVFTRNGAQKTVTATLAEAS